MWGQDIWVIDQVWGQDGWILAKFFFCEFMDRDGVEVPWSQRLSCILNWQILRREPLLLIVFIGTKRWEPRKESLWSRPLGTSLSCHQLLTVVYDWRIFLIALRVIWLDGLNIFGDGSGVSIFTFMGRCGELLLYQRIFLPGKEKVFVVSRWVLSLRVFSKIFCR